MYNRYIPNDQGVYVRVTEPEPWDGPQGSQEQGRETYAPPGGSDRSRGGGYDAYGGQPSGGDPGGQGILQGILGRLHLGDLDTGDLLLLAIMFLLFKDNGDEELLMALGLLLIL